MAAIRAAGEQFAAEYRAIGDELLAARATDILDVAGRIADRLTGSHAAAPVLERPSIIAAADLTPSLTATLPRDRMLGIALAEGSATAHAAILARAYGIPAVVGIGGLLDAIDGAAGTPRGQRGPPRARRRQRRGRARAGRRHGRPLRAGPHRGGRGDRAGTRRGRPAGRDPRRAGGDAPGEHRRAGRIRPGGGAGRPRRGAVSHGVSLPGARDAAVRGRAAGCLPGGRGGVRAPSRHDPVAGRRWRQAHPVPAHRAGGQPVPGRPRAPPGVGRAGPLPDPAAGRHAGRSRYAGWHRRGDGADDRRRPGRRPPAPPRRPGAREPRGRRRRARRDRAGRDAGDPGGHPRGRHVSPAARLREHRDEQPPPVHGGRRPRQPVACPLPGVAASGPASPDPPGRRGLRGRRDLVVGLRRDGRRRRGGARTGGARGPQAEHGLVQPGGRSPR